MEYHLIAKPRRNEEGSKMDQVGYIFRHIAKGYFYRPCMGAAGVRYRKKYLPTLFTFHYVKMEEEAQCSMGNLRGSN